jgi:prepilin-type N-terminal cleavage/methylation domain-containing protein
MKVRRPSERAPARALSGFSLLELLIVVTMVGLLALIGVPKFRVVRDQNNVAAARARVESAIATAKAAAIHKGRLSRFEVTGNGIAVWTQDPTTGSWQSTLKWMDLGSVFPGIQIQVGGPGIANVYYEPRGLTWSGAKPPSTLVFRLVGQTRRDSVCVTRQGQILPRGCTL